MKDAVIVSAVRTPVGKAKRGGLATVRPDEMAAIVIQELINRTPNLDPAQIEDVVIGCAFPEGEQGLNMARMIALRAGLPDSVPAETINRYCASGVQSIAHVAYAIQSGQIETGIAGVLDFITVGLGRAYALLNYKKTGGDSCFAFPSGWLPCWRLARSWPRKRRRPFP